MKLVMMILQASTTDHDVKSRTKSTHNHFMTNFQIYLFARDKLKVSKEKQRLREK